jgi:hypothetical protein
LESGIALDGPVMLSILTLVAAVELPPVFSTAVTSLRV